MARCHTRSSSCFFINCRPLDPQATDRLSFFYWNFGFLGVSGFALEVESIDDTPTDPCLVS